MCGPEACVHAIQQVGCAPFCDLPHPFLHSDADAGGYDGATDAYNDGAGGYDGVDAAGYDGTDGATDAYNDGAGGYDGVDAAGYDGTDGATDAYNDGTARFLSLHNGVWSDLPSLHAPQHVSYPLSTFA